MKEVSDRAHAELLALQDLAVADIAFYKQQQWQICNHALVLYAAIAAVPKFLGVSINCWELTTLVTASILILLAGLWLISDMEKSLSKGRDRLPALRIYFDKEISLPAYAAGKNPEEALIGSKDKLSLNKFFYAVLVFSCVFTIWLLVRISNA